MGFKVVAQIPSNTNAVGFEYNLLFNAMSKYTVTQTGSALFDGNMVFDGKLEPSYSAINGALSGPPSGTPTVILIEGLPTVHTQAGAWIGWTTRYCGAKHFKIEGFDAYANVNVWKTLADYSVANYYTTTVVNSYNVKVPVSGAFTKLRFTFYAGNDPAQYDGMIGISELHFIHPEATTPYANLIGMNNKNGKIGIGTDNPQTMLHLRYSYNDITPHLPIIRFEETYSTRPYRRYIDITGGFSFDVKNESNTNLLSISPYGFDLKLGGTNFHLGEGNSIIDEGKSIYFSGGAASSFTFRNDNGNSTIICGSLWAKDEVVVQTSNPWPDYVFAPEYKLMPLKELEIFIKNNKHLPGVHSANKIKEEGVKLSENIVILLQKIEGLTLYTIKQQEEIDNLKSQMKSFNNK